MSRESLEPKLLPLAEDMPWPFSRPLLSKSSTNHVALDDDARSVKDTYHLLFTTSHISNSLHDWHYLHLALSWDSPEVQNIHQISLIKTWSTTSIYCMSISSWDSPAVQNTHQTSLIKTWSVTIYCKSILSFLSSFSHSLFKPKHHDITSYVDPNSSLQILVEPLFKQKKNHQILLNTEWVLVHLHFASRYHAFIINNNKN